MKKLEIQIQVIRKHSPPPPAPVIPYSTKVINIGLFDI